MPTTLVDEILLYCHDSIEGGHQRILRTHHKVDSEYYWIELYADVVRQAQACEYCSTSKRKTALKGYSPGKMVSKRPFQLVSMDFVIPLPGTRRDNTPLLLLQDHLTRFVIAKAMNGTTALAVAKMFKENTFVISVLLVSYVTTDPWFMSKVF